MDYVKLPLRKGTVTILDLAGYKAIVKIQNYLICTGIENESQVPFIKWRILRKVYVKPRFNYCKLCLMEKLCINTSIGNEILLNTSVDTIINY